MSSEKMSSAKAGDGGEHLAPVTYLPSAREAAWAVPGVTEPSHDAAESRGDEARVPERQARRASNVSMAGLGRRNMSRWELERLLRARELDELAIESELARLEGVGLIDDAALAHTLVRTQHERKGLGRQAIVAELRRRHIDQEIIDAALAELDGDDERERAFALAEKRGAQLAGYDHETATRRLTGFLQRKGYSSGIIRDAVTHALGTSRRGGSTVRFE
ncbi:recombination regulator RecX [Salinibacterium sp. SYSU T00001]|uniref:regulatory protein RecX n=1 Tax=Homoserinimonas sedimenticola TaxID=2986805 RepID=UPI0022359838|nr:regulatory protein RecX [Salinibacterium sedimenticola]MCW4386768.1 recombination regulator RecX [Salinibacterium sedimenticola]